MRGSVCVAPQRPAAGFPDTTRQLDSTAMNPASAAKKNPEKNRFRPTM
jgi:hypothetical protein